MSWSVAERRGRDLSAAIGVLGGFAPLAWVTPRVEGASVRDAVIALGALGLNLWLAHKADDPLDAGDGYWAVRVRRYAPLALGWALAGAVLFPTLVVGSYLWSLWLLAWGLSAFAYVARVRTVLLVLATAAGLASVALDERAAPCLGALAWSWFGVPLGEHLAYERAEGPSGAGSAWGHALASLLGVGGVWVGTFVVVWWLGPEGGGVGEDAVGSGIEREVLEAPELPLTELLILAALVAGSAFALRLYAARQGRGSTAAPVGVGSASAREAGALPEAAPVGVAWPPGPRRAVVEAYVASRARLGSQGLPPGATPRRRAEALGERGRVPGRRLAEAFERARWSPRPVTAEDAEQARADARAVEDAESPEVGS